MGAMGECLEQVLRVLPEQGVDRDRLRICLQLGLGRQLSILEEPDDFEKGRVLGQLLDQVAAVVEDTLVATDVGDRRLALGGVCESPVDRGEPEIGPEPADVRCELTLDALHHIEASLLVAVADEGISHSSPSFVGSVV